MSASTRTIPIRPVGPAARTGAAIHPRMMRGVWQNWRIAAVLLTQIVYYGLPWLVLDGRQAVLFDILDTRFYLFGLVFLPQDFIYLTALLVCCAIGLFLWTAVGGRLWCGFACPQTVYTELFVWIERAIEGERGQRIKLDAAPWGPAKLMRRGCKHGLWILLALWTGFTFVGYFSPIRGLWHDVLVWQAGPWELFWIGFYALATYGLAGFLRESVCKHMCPYARFQGVMFDPDTLLVAYDRKRGEPRSHKSARGGGAGDCVDCTLCVQVCPAGIDIRDGLQYECIGCGVCIDACNTVMDKLGLPRGLVAYTSDNVLEGRAATPRILRPRIVLYGGILLAVCALTAISLVMRAPVKVNVARDRSVLVRTAEDGNPENVYRLHAENVSARPIRYRVEAEGLAGVAVATEDRAGASIAPLGVAERSVRLRAEDDGLTKGGHDVWLLVRDAESGAVLARERTRFIAP